MQTFHDLGYALRQLRRSPGFAITSVLTLTMAIAANVVVFGVLHGLMLHPLPVAEPDHSGAASEWNFDVLPGLSGYSRSQPDIF